MKLIRLTIITMLLLLMTSFQAFALFKVSPKKANGVRGNTNSAASRTVPAKSHLASAKYSTAKHAPAASTHSGTPVSTTASTLSTPAM